MRERVRVLDDADLDAAQAVVARDPVANCFVQSRIDAVGLDPRRLGAEMWGYTRDGVIEALCYCGANMVPVGADAAACVAFAARARRSGRHCSSVVGPVEQVDVLWGELESDWGPARDVRRPQPLLVIDDEPLVDPDPDVRRVSPEELDVLFPACVAMFTEEVGISPVGSDGGHLYRARVGELIQEGRSFARIERGEVLFKAEIGAAARGVCQVQGVWVHPDLRGRGLGTAGTAAVVRHAQADIAPAVSLYVNEFNYAARHAYQRVGFREIGAFASILF